MNRVLLLLVLAGTIVSASGETADLGAGGLVWRSPFPGSPRALAGIALDPTRQQVWVYGGLGNEAPGVYADLWVYDIQGDEWSPVAAIGETPPGLRGADLEFDPATDRLILVGGTKIVRPGEIDAPCRKELWEFHPSTSRWQVRDLEGIDRATPLGSATGALNLSTGDYWAFGGACQGDTPYSASFLYSRSANAWEYLPFPTEGPKRRLKHTVAYEPDGPSLLMFGGNTQLDYEPDWPGFFQELAIVWRFELKYRKWVPLSHGTERRVQFSGAGAFDCLSELLFVQGGRIGYYLDGSPTPPYLSDELWGFDVGNRAWTLVESLGEDARREDASAVYCPCEGELFVFGGRQAPPPPALPTYFPQEKQFYSIPVERKAQFVWDGDRRIERSRSSTRWGSLQLVGEELNRPGIPGGSNP